jgi:AbiU2
VTLLAKLQRLEQVILRARSHFDIWRVYSGPDTRKQLLPTMQQYSEFFRFDEHAHQFTFIGYLYQLLDRSKGTISLLALIDEATAAAFPETAVAKARATVVQMQPVWKAICILRSNLFAHRSDSLGWEEAYLRANVTPNQICTFIEQGLEALHSLLSVTGSHMNDFSNLPRAHIIRLTLVQNRKSENRLPIMFR